MASITLDKLAHSYSANPRTDADFALKEIDYQWEDGGAYALLGPSGCGKTTLLNIISGLLVPSKGHIRFDGQDVTHLQPEERNIAQVFQFPVIYDTMTVRENLAFPLINRRVPRDEITRRVNDMIDVLDLSDKADRKARGLTADEKQKISLGRGLVRYDVNAILFDEPLTVIDPHMKWQLRTKLKDLHRQLGHTMIYVTHDQVEAMTMADKIVVLRDGYVEQIGRPLDLYHNPANLFVAGFIGSPAMNLMEGKISGISDKALEVELQGQQKVKVLCNPNENAQTGAPVHFGVRPEHLDPEGNGDAKITAKVFAVERLGGETYLYVNTRDGSELTVHAPGDKVVTEGQEISVGVNSESCHVFSEQGLAYERLAA